MKKFILKVQSGIGWFTSAQKSETQVFPTFLFARTGAGAAHLIVMNADFIAGLEFWEREKGVSREVLMPCMTATCPNGGVTGSRDHGMRLGLPVGVRMSVWMGHATHSRLSKGTRRAGHPPVRGGNCRSEFWICHG